MIFIFMIHNKSYQKRLMYNIIRENSILFVNILIKQTTMV